MGNGYVYIIEKEDKLIKIGKTINFEQRLRTLETQGAFKIKRRYISPVCNNYSQLETKMHTFFKEHRTIGEWFNIDFETAVKKLKKMGFKTENIKCKPINTEWITEMAIKACSRGCEEITGKLNLDLWVPTDEDIEKAKEDMKISIESLIGDCEEYEEADKLQKQLDILCKSKDEKQIKDIIQDFYGDEYYSVPYEYLEKCFGIKEKEFLFKVLGVKEIISNPTEDYLRKRSKEIRLSG